MAYTPGPITVSPGDQGGALTNGVAQHRTKSSLAISMSGRFDAVAGQKISMREISQTSEARRLPTLAARRALPTGHGTGQHRRRQTSATAERHPVAHR